MTAPDPRLDEIQARLSAATPGPWKAQNLEQEHGHGGIFWVSVDRPDEIKTVAEVDANDDGVEAIWRFADAEFIANAPADIAFLLAELRKAREALGRVEEVAARLHWEADNANEGAKYAAEVNQGASLMALESERFAYQKAEHLIRAAVAAAKGDERG